jgi:hypothetical protein
MSHVVYPLGFDEWDLVILVVGNGISVLSLVELNLRIGQVAKSKFSLSLMLFSLCFCSLLLFDFTHTSSLHQLRHFRTTIYLEGNLETKVFSDPITGLVRRIREIAVRGNGMLLLRYHY